MVDIIFTTTTRSSRRGCNAHAHAYIREGIELAYQANAEGERFLREKLVELREKLEKSELALNNYRVTRNRAGSPCRWTARNRRNRPAVRLEQAADQRQVARIRTRGEVEQINKHQFTVVPQETGTPAGGGWLRRLASALSDYAAMSKHSSPTIAAGQLKARIDRLQQTDNETTGSTPKRRGVLRRGED